MSDFKNLIVWRKAHALALNVRRVACRIRGADDVPLRGQMIRAALSIPTNLVEGAGQVSRKDFARFILIALNSTTELEYHLIVARDVCAISELDFRSLTDQTIEVRKMLHGLRNRVVSTPRLARDNVPQS
ncbi:MAG TPA: four helix bundle protein [Gemmatimonadaceae bacterium]|nr:four helix bundle protein [Gemmatimonadaceae bacterium]